MLNALKPHGCTAFLAYETKYHLQRKQQKMHSGVFYKCFRKIPEIGKYDNYFPQILNILIHFPRNRIFQFLSILSVSLLLKFEKIVEF